MKLSIQEPFKGIEILSTLFYALLHCCFDTSLNSGKTCRFSCLGQTTKVFTCWDQVNRFPHPFKASYRIVILNFKDEYVNLFLTLRLK